MPTTVHLRWVDGPTHGRHVLWLCMLHGFSPPHACILMSSSILRLPCCHGKDRVMLMIPWYTCGIPNTVAYCIDTVTYRMSTVSRRKAFCTSERGQKDVLLVIRTHSSILTANDALFPWQIHSKTPSTTRSTVDVLGIYQAHR